MPISERLKRAASEQLKSLLGDEITLEEFFPFGLRDNYFFPPFSWHAGPTSRPGELTLPPKSVVGKDVLLPPPAPSRLCTPEVKREGRSHHFPSWADGGGTHIKFGCILAQKEQREHRQVGIISHLHLWLLFLICNAPQ